MSRIRSHRAVALVLVALFPALVAAQGEAAQTHTVRRGDTLWDIAKQYLGDAFRWPEIDRRNKSTLEDPNRIYPEQFIIISGDVMATPSTPSETPSGPPMDTAVMGDQIIPQQDPVLPPVGHQIIFGAKASDGVVPGDQMTLQVPGHVAADGTQLPPLDIAVAQVTRVTPWGASAIIISQTDGGVKTGMTARLSAKMP